MVECRGLDVPGVQHVRAFMMIENRCGGLTGARELPDWSAPDGNELVRRLARRATGLAPDEVKMRLAACGANALFDTRHLDRADGLRITATGAAAIPLIEAEKPIMRRLGRFQEINHSYITRRNRP